MNWHALNSQINLDTSEIATVLALISAIAHAAFGALQKGKHNPWLVRGSIDFWYFLISLPIALFIVPFPTTADWILLLGAFLIHTIYKIFHLMAYTRADYTAVYPVVRGISPIATVILAFFVFGEVFNLVQWMGVMVLSISIIFLGTNDIIRNKSDMSNLLAALFFAFITGVFVALYTVFDAFSAKKASSSDSEKLTATAGTTSLAGNHSFTVSRLATAHTIVSKQYSSAGTVLSSAISSKVLQNV